MEPSWIDQVSDSFGKAIGILIALAIIYGAWWSLIWCAYNVKGMIVERFVSRKRMRSRKREEAAAISDGVAILLDSLKTAGILNDQGVKYWQKKLKATGLKDIDQEASFGKPWYKPVVQSVIGLKHRIINHRKHEEAQTQDSLEKSFSKFEVK